MAFSVLLKPSGKIFSTETGSSILDSAIKSDVHLEHSCMDGSCGACKAKLVRGEVKQLNIQKALTSSETEEGYILTCCTEAISSLELVANYYPQLAAIKKIVQPCKVEDLSFPSNDVAILKLKIPPAAKFNYLAGQYIQLIVKGERRSYSIANSKDSYSGIELHVRRVADGLFSEFIFNELKIGQLLRFEGPIGSFFVREADTPIVFLAGGTGFAPVKAMVEQLIEQNSSREIYIYWGASTKSGFYSNLASEWQSKCQNIHYIPVFSGDGTYDGRKGLVHKAVIEDIREMSEYEVYACGSPLMIEAARKDFMNSGLDSNNFYSDAFVSSDK